MAAVARWAAVDPLAEKHPEWSSYNYVLDNPAALLDPDGRQVAANDPARFFTQGPLRPGVFAGAAAQAGSNVVAEPLMYGLLTVTPVEGVASTVLDAATGAFTWSGTALNFLPGPSPRKLGSEAVEAVADIAQVGTAREFRQTGLKDAHHVIQDAAVRDVPGYSRLDAPVVQLPGPSTSSGTPHSRATQVQRQPGGGTYGAERRIAYKALRRAGMSERTARTVMARVHAFFARLGVGRDTPTRIPGNRED
jgi:hypothetical protein